MNWPRTISTEYTKSSSADGTLHSSPLKLDSDLTAFSQPRVNLNVTFKFKTRPDSTGRQLPYEELQDSSLKKLKEIVVKKYGAWLYLTNSDTLRLLDAERTPIIDPSQIKAGDTIYIQKGTSNSFTP